MAETLDLVTFDTGSIQTSDSIFHVMVSERELIGQSEGIDIEYADGNIEDFEEEYININFSGDVSKPEKADYFIAASCGLLSGFLSVLWDKSFSLDEAHKFGNKKADIIVKDVAKSLGYKKDDLEGAIRFLENKFPMAGDSLTAIFGGGKQHHLRDFSHHPTPLGLICSILMQFSKTGFGTDTQGRFIHVRIENSEFVGTTFSDKIVFGTLNWFMHMISDFDGSSGSVFNGTGKGTGIPGPILSLLKELSSLPIFKKVNDKNINNPKIFSEYVSKLFNGTLIETDNGEKVPFDLRTEMGIGHYIAEQIKPVVINECLVRTSYMITRFISEVKDKKIQTLSELNRIEPSKILPINSRALSRMITVSSGSFVAINISGTAVKAAINSKGNAASFSKEFFLSINYAGIGRFVFACASDSEYLKADIKESYEKYQWEKDELKNKQFKFGYQFMSLNSEQTKVLYSLKALSVEYDINKTNDQKCKLIKQEWLRQWKKATIESFNVASEDYFMNSDEVYPYISDIEKHGNSKGWMNLLSLELALFQAYYTLDEKQKELFKGLKYSNRYIFDIYVKEQCAITEKDLTAIVKTYKNYVSRLKESGKKVALGVAVAAGTTIATGGLALAFAPEIAVVLAGEAVAGLSGAALTSASLAAIGGGSLAAGGLGMAGGTAILTGGGALLGLAGSSSASLLAVLSQTSDQYTLNECAKLLSFCKLVVLGKYNRPELLNPIINGIERCINEIQMELDSADKKSKEYKKSEKNVRLSLNYLKRCLFELDRLLHQDIHTTEYPGKQIKESKTVLQIKREEG